MSTASYYPILKWKKGEQIALKELAIGDSEFIPVLELVDDIAPASFFSTLKECFRGAIYIDTIRCDENRILLNSMIDYANSNGIDARPLLYPDDVYEFYDELAEKTSYLAFKISVPEDFDGISYDTIAEYITEHEYNCAIDIFLDAEEVLNNKDASVAFTSYKSQLDKIDIDSEIINKVVICLTSFPEKLDMEAGGTVAYKRYDIKIFEKLNELYPKYELAYSDYGVTKFTESELDFSRMKFGILPKIKYTTNNEYIVLKGEKDRSRGLVVRSVIDMAREIVGSSYYSGKEFSYGDSAIYEKATLHNSKPGGSTQWVTYCSNHHLTFVMKQLSNLVGI